MKTKKADILKHRMTIKYKGNIIFSNTIKGVVCNHVLMGGDVASGETLFDIDAPQLKPVPDAQCEVCAALFDGSGQVCPDCMETHRTGERPI